MLDWAEEQPYGRGRRGDELPTELRDPATRRQRLREAQARLEAERKRELAAQKQAHVEQKSRRICACSSGEIWKRSTLAPLRWRDQDELQMVLTA